jgi:hypothetical protein
MQGTTNASTIHHYGLGRNRLLALPLIVLRSFSEPSCATLSPGERAVAMTKSPRDTEEQKRNDLAYLLRLWRMRGEVAAGWRSSLTSPDSGERHGFASLEDLCSFL